MSSSPIPTSPRPALPRPPCPAPHPAAGGLCAPAAAAAGGAAGRGAGGGQHCGGVRPAAAAQRAPRDRAPGGRARPQPRPAAPAGFLRAAGCSSERPQYLCCVRRQLERATAGSYVHCTVGPARLAGPPSASLPPVRHTTCTPLPRNRHGRRSLGARKRTQTGLCFPAHCPRPSSSPSRSSSRWVKGGAALLPLCAALPWPAVLCFAASLACWPLASAKLDCKQGPRTSARSRFRAPPGCRRRGRRRSPQPQQAQQRRRQHRCACMRMRREPWY